MGVLSDGEQRDEADGAVVLMQVPSKRSGCQALLVVLRRGPVTESGQ